MRSYRFLPPLGVALALFFMFALRTTHRTTVHVDTNPMNIIIAPPPSQDPIRANARPTIELAFVLDTTGSMGGLIDAAKQKVWGIINNVMKSPLHPRVKVGLVAYRDHGDVYITKVLPITDDLDEVYTTLMDYRAEGGGDTPEDVRQAMADAVNKVGWSQSSPDLAQIMFLVGDAPPHDDYSNEPDCLASAAEAVRRGIIVNTIECGNAQDTKVAWKEIAQHGQGQFMAIAEDGGVQTIATPYDADLSRLGSTVDTTYVAYGGSSLGRGSAAAGAFRAEKTKAQAFMDGHIATTAPAAAQAERAVNKAINADAYSYDLVQDTASGKVSLDKIKKEDLPDNLQTLAAPALKAEIDQRVAQRKALQSQILDLEKKRDAYIADSSKKQNGAGGFDAVVTGALKKEAATRGIKL